MTLNFLIYLAFVRVAVLVQCSELSSRAPPVMGTDTVTYRARIGLHAASLHPRRRSHRTKHDGNMDGIEVGIFDGMVEYLSEQKLHI